MHTLTLRECMRAALVTLCFVPTLLVAQQPSRSSRNVAALAGRASFTVPDEWHVLSEVDSARVGQFVYHIRNPALDSISNDRANVVVNIQSRSGTRTFQAGSDTLLGGLIGPSMTVLGDTIVGRTQRAVFWRGQLKDMPYVGYDNIGQVGNVWVHIRIVLPVSQKTPMDWNARFSEDCERLLRSVRVTGRAAFPTSIGYPALVSFGSGNAGPTKR